MPPLTTTQKIAGFQSGSQCIRDYLAQLSAQWAANPTSWFAVAECYQFLGQNRYLGSGAMADPQVVQRLPEETTLTLVEIAQMIRTVGTLMDEAFVAIDEVMTKDASGSWVCVMPDRDDQGALTGTHRHVSFTPQQLAPVLNILDQIVAAIPE